MELSSLMEWASYRRVLEPYFFERTSELRELEKQLFSPLPDSLHWSRRFEYPWILSNLKATGRHVLDVGAGSTVLQFQIARSGGMRVSSIDPDEAAVSWVNARTAPRRSMHSGCQAGALPSIPYGDGAFHVAICISVIEHLPKDEFLRSVDELIRVSSEETLITMDVVMNNADAKQVTLDDVQQVLCPKLKCAFAPVPRDAMTHVFGGNEIGVCCLRIKKQ